MLRWVTIRYPDGIKRALAEENVFRALQAASARGEGITIYTAKSAGMVLPPGFYFRFEPADQDDDKAPRIVATETIRTASPEDRAAKVIARELKGIRSVLPLTREELEGKV